MQLLKEPRRQKCDVLCRVYQRFWNTCFQSFEKDIKMVTPPLKSSTLDTVHSVLTVFIQCTHWTRTGSFSSFTQFILWNH
jgi:hypothetical protein